MQSQTTHRKPFSQALAQSILGIMSWRLVVDLPTAQKYVLIGAPHTSNWDFLFLLLLMGATGIKLRWIGKTSIFYPPYGWLMRRLGGIPVIRESSHDFVNQMVNLFHQNDHFVIAISPEGTRKKLDHWKSGFYYIASCAGVPIALGFIDYPEKVIGIGPCIYPTGDIQADFALIQKFYAGKKGVHPHLASTIQPRSTP